MIGKMDKIKRERERVNEDGWQHYERENYKKGKGSSRERTLTDPEGI